MRTLNSERQEKDLESGHDELRELNFVHHDFVNALDSVGNYITSARRRALSEDSSDAHPDEEEEMHDEGEASDDELEFVNGEDYVLDHLAPEYDPSQADLLASKLAALLVNSEAEEDINPTQT